MKAFRQIASPLLAVALSVSSLAAQKSPIGKDTWIVGGGAALVSSHVDGGSDITSFSVAPNILRFVAPHVAIGGLVALGYQNNTTSSGWSYGIGPAVRYYFGEESAKTFPFIAASFTPQWQKLTLKNPANGQSADVDNRFTTVDASVGITQMLATHVGVTGEAFYAHRSFTVTQFSATQKQRDIGLRVGFTAFVF
jgi:hypothetical protein